MACESRITPAADLEAPAATVPLTLLGESLVARVALFLDAPTVSALACSCSQTATLNEERHWAARGRQGWAAPTLRAYLRLSSWRRACEAALVFRGLCAAAATLGVDVPALPLSTPYAVRVATVDRTVEALQRAVAASDGTAPGHWGGVLHLAAFFLIALRQVPAFRRGLPSAAYVSSARGVAAMRAEVPVLLWAAFLFLGDALPSSERGFARRWAAAPAPALVLRTIALFRVLARPVARACLVLLRHTHPATLDPVRDAAGALLMRVVAASRALGAAVQFSPSHVLAVAARAIPGPPPARVPAAALERRVRDALIARCDELVGDGIWEQLERLVLPEWCAEGGGGGPAAAAEAAAPAAAEASASSTASVWSAWQAGLAALPFDVAEAVVVGVCMALIPPPSHDDPSRPRGLTVDAVLAGQSSDEPGALVPATLSTLTSDFIPGSSPSDGFVPFSEDAGGALGSRVWVAQAVVRPPQPPPAAAAAAAAPALPWPAWSSLAARAAAAGLFASSTSADLAAFALPDDAGAPLRALLADLEARERGLAARCGRGSRLARYAVDVEADVATAEEGHSGAWGGGSAPAAPRRLTCALASLSWLLQQQAPDAVPVPEGAVPCPAAPAARALPPADLRRGSPPAEGAEPDLLPPGDPALVRAMLNSGLLPRTAAWALVIAFPVLLAGPLGGYARLVAAGRMAPLSALPAPLLFQPGGGGGERLRWLHLRPAPDAQAVNVDAEIELLLDRVVRRSEGGDDPSVDACSPPGLTCRLLAQPPASRDVADPWGVFPLPCLRPAAIVEAACCVVGAFVRAVRPDLPPLVLLKVC